MSANQQTRNRKPRKPHSDFQRLSRRFMSGLLRSLFLLGQPNRYREAGFVLPTAALLLLVLTLTVGTLSFRTFSRSSSVVALREQQVVDSAAAPAIDRAKAKLEYLFSRDVRFPGGIPSSDVIASMMLNDGTNGIPQVTANDPYTFPDETRVDINGGNNDNAWVFTADVDGNGTTDPDELVVYSVLMDDENGAVSLIDDLSTTKANALVTRNGPINTSDALSGCSTSRAPEAGWQVVSEATLEKNFQVTAFVANRSDVNRTASALDFQQVRQADRGNKWGAWFKYDLELFPGASRDFFWNGAMHTEGNFLVRDKYVARMISSHNSCLYTQDAAEITLASSDNFEGQVLSAKSGANNFFEDSTNGSNPLFHLFTSDGQKPDTGTDGYIDSNNDSVDAAQRDLRNILLDPIKLFTEDVLAHRNSSGWSRNSNWGNDVFVGRQRIYNENTATPYLDDTYRADNRYGPKAVYDDNNAIPSGSSVGDTITSNTTLTALDAANDIYGLDGYWERRAIGQGLRIIVGQRLELGNTFGWGGTTEPLYPTNNTAATEARQRKTLYDNLSAVQGMVVYHHELNNNGALPAACIAATVHPGTETTLINSRTFNTVDINGTATLNTDFFNGVGTNGWEFTFPYTTDSGFEAAIAADQPLGKVLRNLGTFAGDPLGGAPSFQPTQDNDIHPNPYMAAWGNFSSLRRILASGTAYANLSPADQSALHSAACTVGMLSYNLGNEIQLSTTFSGSANALGNHMDKLLDGDGGNGANKDIDAFIGELGSDGELVIKSGAKGRDGFGSGDWVDTVDNSVIGNSDYRTGCSSETLGTGASAYNRACDAADYYAQFTEEDFYRAILNKNGLGASVAAKYADAAAIIERGSQFQRDRLLGFRTGGVPVIPSSDEVVWDIDSGLVNDTYTGAQVFTGCDPNIFDGATPQDSRKIALAMSLCKVAGKDVKHPSLYYLFPYFTHDHNGRDDSATTGVLVNHTQPPAEEYINDAYVESKNINGTESDYYAVSDADILAISSAFSPKATDFNDWVLPTTAASILSSPNTQAFTITINTGTATGRDVALLDKGMYDGRELMGLRMLDIDINKLSANTVSTATGSDHWIADTDGIVYAFREDAAREDSIVRPKDSSTNWSDCDTWGEVYTNSGSGDFAVTGNNRNCRLEQLSSSPFLQDPPLMDGTKINTKPIDFYADPGRRPHGFRLVNGETLNRASDVQSGMTFVSDNMVYIKGDFNLHSATGALGSGATACSSLIEEFTDKLISDNCQDRTSLASGSIDFYDARDVTERNDTNFSEPAQDQWRPVEIVGDAVGVLSESFRDGNIEEGFTLERDTSGSTGTSSYQNQNRLNLKNNDSLFTGFVENGAVPSNYWRHADPADTTTPIVINRNGGLTKSDDSVIGNSQYVKFNDSFADFQNKRGYDLQPASRTIVNAVFISGIIPSQAGQTYGGMHNFPRFLEQWNGVDLHISGGFFQLNFSTSATAPFDQDAWEPGADPQLGTNAFRVRFYGAPNRIWGYDVGLQYAPAGPIARRFVTVGTPRSEFYRDLPIDDPYVQNLRCTTFNGSQVDPTATCP
ncbi:MAG: hormogonium polysaccharide biosynthesis protein HpsA [Phormidesmis sp.]